jgi:hypothetical protein
MSDVQVITTSDATHATGRYFSAELECGAHAALVVVAPAYIAVVVRNAANAAHRGMGKEFPTLDAALAYYKTAAIGAMLRTAVELSQARPEPPPAGEPDDFDDPLRFTHRMG